MENVNVIVGRFQPFTLGHTKGAEQVYKDHKLRTVFLIVNTPKSKVDSRHPFESEQIIKDNSGCNEDWFAGMFGIQNADIGKIATVCRDNGFEPVMWTCGTDRYSSYSRQASEKYINMYNLTPDFKVNEIKRTDDDISASAVRQSLKDDDRKDFEKMMPKWTWSKFNIYKSIVSAVKESKTLSSYIKESIYGNLGIDHEINIEKAKKWEEIYNRQHTGFHNEKAYRYDCEIVLPKQLVIYDTRLLEDGHLPDGIKFSFPDPHNWSTYFYIKTPKFTSFKNFPEVDDLNIYCWAGKFGAPVCGITDWKMDSTETNIVELEAAVELKSTKNINDSITTLITSKPDNLKLFKGINVNRLNLQHADYRGKENIIGDFLKNNNFKKLSTFWPVQINMVEIAYDSLDFLNELKSPGVTVYFCPREHDGVPDDIYYAPLKNPNISSIRICDPCPLYRKGTIPAANFEEEKEKMIAIGVSKTKFE